MNKFKLGDLVQLKSGGPKMTVDEFTIFNRKESVWCTWFVGTKQEKGEFSPDALKLAE